MRTIYCVHIKRVYGIQPDRKKQVKIDKKKKKITTLVVLASDRISPDICASTLRSATILSFSINTSKLLRSCVFNLARSTRIATMFRVRAKMSTTVLPEVAFEWINKNCKKIRRGRRYPWSLQC